MRIRGSGPHSKQWIEGGLSQFTPFPPPTPISNTCHRQRSSSSSCQWWEVTEKRSHRGRERNWPTLHRSVFPLIYSLMEMESRTASSQLQCSQCFSPFPTHSSYSFFHQQTMRVLTFVYGNCGLLGWEFDYFSEKPLWKNKAIPSIKGSWNWAAADVRLRIITVNYPQNEIINL